MPRILPRLALVVLLLLPATLTAQSAEDRAAVERASIDYLDVFYEGDSTKIFRSIRPEVQKYGFFRQRDASAYRGMAMSYQEMFDYARNVRTTGRGGPPAGAVKKVELLDVQDQTAATKVTAWWGTDYLHLAKYDGRWMILHVIWQGPPR